MASTNGERNMRPRGRMVEKRVGSAQCAIKRIRVSFSGAKDTKNGIPQEKRTENSSGKADCVRNQKKKVPIVPWTAVSSMFTTVSCVQCSSALMSPAE